MTSHDHSDDRQQGRRPFLTSRTGLALLGFLAIGAFFLLTEHRAHVLGALPYLLLLACPLLHLFHGHGGHSGHTGHDTGSSSDGSKGSGT
jgi:hypothetical protein